MNQLQNIKILDKAIRDNETAKDLLYKRIDALREAEEKIEEKIRIIDDNLKVEFKIGLQSKELILKGIERQFAEWLIGDSDKPFFISPDTKEIMPVAILNEQIPELIDYIKIENVECVAYLSGRIQGYKGRETYIDNVDSHSCNFENNKYSSDIDIYNLSDLYEYLIFNAPEEGFDWGDQDTTHVNITESFHILLYFKKN